MPFGTPEDVNKPPRRMYMNPAKDAFWSTKDVLQTSEGFFYVWVSK